MARVYQPLKRLILSAFLTLGHITHAYNFTFSWQSLQPYWQTITNQLHRHSQALIGVTTATCAAICAYKAYRCYQKRLLNKLKALEVKYLDQVNTEMKNYLNSFNIKEEDLNLDLDENKKLLKSLDGDPLGEKLIDEAPTNDKKIPADLNATITDFLTALGIDTSRVLIYLDDPDVYYMSSYESAKKNKLLIRMCMKLPNINNAKQMLIFKSALAHEAAHLIYKDSLKKLLIFVKKQKQSTETVKRVNEAVNCFVKICEKRADIFSVFHSPNPYEYALFLKNIPHVSDGLYTHRNQPEWETMMNEIKACQPL